MAETTDIAELRALVEEQGRHHATEFEELRQQNQLLQQALIEMMMRFPSESESEGDDTTSVSPAAISPPPEPFPNSTFAPYRRELNAVILQTKLDAMAEASKGKKATGKRSYDDLTMAYSPITRPKVQRLYEKSMHEDKDDTEFPIAEIDKSCLESLCTELKRQRRELGSCRLTASEQRRKLSINTVMYHTKELFNEDFIKIEFEAYLRNSSFDSVDVADLLVSRGKCKIVVVESNSHNLLQGQAQDLSLMEIAFADNEKNEEVPTPVFGIVSSFTDWIFYRYDVNGIYYTLDSVNEDRNLDADVHRAVGRIYAMLAADSC